MIKPIWRIFGNILTRAQRRRLGLKRRGIQHSRAIHQSPHRVDTNQICALETRSLLSSTLQQFPNINPGSSSSSPERMAEVNGTLYFTANDGNTGHELWKVNATGGVELVADINMSPSNSYTRNLTNVNGVLYFFANDGNTGYELWKVNAAGQVELVADIKPGSNSSYLYNLTNLNGTLYFSADNGTNGNELWKVNETGEVEQLTDIIPGAGHGNPNYFTEVNGTIFFSAENGVTGIELYKLSPDGVVEKVLDINTGNASNHASYLTNVNGTLYYTAAGNNGGELRKVNSNEGSEFVAQVYHRSSRSLTASYTNINGTLYFLDNDLFTGSLIRKVNAQGVVEQITDIMSGSNLYNARYLTNVNGTAYFRANDGTTGYELWKINAAGGAERVADIKPGSNSSHPTLLTNVNGTLFFTANDGTTGEELWKVNASGGVERVTDINPGSPDSNIQQLTNVNGTIFFQANDGTNGAELWSYTDNQRPNTLELSINSLPENQSSNTLIGTLTTTDPDDTVGFTYSLISVQGETVSSSLTIVNDELYSNTVFDYENRSSYTIVVRTTDSSGASFDQEFTINVTNVNEAPTAIDLDSNLLVENGGVNAPIGNLSATDPDANETLTFSLTNGVNDNNLFNISGNELRANQNFSIDNGTTYTVTVTVTDAANNTFNQDFTINITTVREIKFDFNSQATSNAAGYNSVLATTIYNPRRGYGWRRGSISAFETTAANLNEKDYHFTRKRSRVFQVDLRNGNYRVTVGVGSIVHAFPGVGISLQGTQVGTINTIIGEYKTQTFNTTVTDGKLNFRLSRINGSLAAINELIVQNEELDR